MIRHRPFGSEHPYLETPDQRVPARPLAGETFELRVAAARSVQTVTCEWIDPSRTLTFPLVVEEAVDAPQATEDDSHLALAATAKRGARVSWTVQAPTLRTGEDARYRFHSTDAAGRSITSRWFMVSPSSWSDEGGSLDVEGASRVVPGSTRWLRDSEGLLRVRFALALGENEHVVGFGERYDQLDQRGLNLDSVVFEQYKNQGEAAKTYLPMPFAHVLGAVGWAFHVETARRCWFDVGASDSTALWVEAALGGGDHESLTVRFLEGTVAEVLRQWLAAVGQPEVLPSWVFELWASSNEWNTQQRVLGEIERHRAEEIPVGVVVIEAWSDEATFTIFRDAEYEVHLDGERHRLADFRFRAEGAWPDPKKMVDTLHEQGVRVLLWQIPLAKMRPSPIGQARADAETLLRNGLVVNEADGRPYRNRGWWFPQGLMPDLTSPEARVWWLAQRQYLVDEVGIDGFKTDGGEHAWGRDLSYADGTRGDEGNNLFPVHYAAAYGELLAQSGKAPVTFSRAGFTGSQAHGVFWAGDQDSNWESLRSCLVAGLSAAACGIIYWGWDLGGFSGEIPDAELYMTAAALSCFVPVMQYHSEFNHHRVPSRDRTPWNIAERTARPEVLTHFRRLATLRSRLVPYLTREAAVSVATGRPLMQSLCLLEGTNDAVWARPYEYLLGGDLLVAPVVAAGTREQSVYLPSGEWIDVWSGKSVTGGVVIDAEVPVERVLVWCRREAWPDMKSLFVDLPALH
ncbi:hypothetical protein acdb102_10720 [Acidothermaceae bacterium B102]|nr:hypothetical protein acdb102_10720 [Acidothermaceae bacterium B102]